MAARHFRVIVEYDAEDEVWVTYVPALGHLSTYGETRDEALEHTREAVLGYLEAAALEHLPVPEDDAEVVEIEVPVP
jgi:predicted RNase H-like HicB family nuclease